MDYTVNQKRIDKDLNYLANHPEDVKRFKQLIEDFKPNIDNKKFEGIYRELQELPYFYYNTFVSLMTMNDFICPEFIEAGFHLPACIEGEFKIPDGTTKIPENFMIYGTNVTKVIIPDTVKEIGKRAFKNPDYRNQWTVVVPNSVKILDDGHSYVDREDNIFAYCTVITKNPIVIQYCQRFNTIHLVLGSK